MKAKRTPPCLQEDLLQVLEVEVHQAALEEVLLRAEAEVHQAALDEALLQVLEVGARRVEPEEARQIQDQENPSRQTPQLMIQTLVKKNEPYTGTFD